MNSRGGRGDKCVLQLMTHSLYIVMEETDGENVFSGGAAKRAESWLKCAIP